MSRETKNTWASSGRRSAPRLSSAAVPRATGKPGTLRPHKASGLKQARALQERACALSHRRRTAASWRLARERVRSWRVARLTDSTFDWSTQWPRATPLPNLKPLPLRPGRGAPSLGSRTELRVMRACQTLELSYHQPVLAPIGNCPRSTAKTFRTRATVKPAEIVPVSVGLAAAQKSANEF